eukprot:12114306-Heterocapsa_arctica.AAC.1
MDKHKIIKLQNSWRNSDDLHDIHRLKDIRDQEYQDHQWITAPAEGAVMAPQKWVTSMRIRLGCHFTATERICGACGNRILDKCCYHATTCAQAESTRGHYLTMDALARPFAQADATTECETE